MCLDRNAFYFNMPYCIFVRVIDKTMNLLGERNKKGPLQFSICNGPFSWFYYFLAASAGGELVIR